jgi:hypothetical protein
MVETTTPQRDSGEAPTADLMVGAARIARFISDDIGVPTDEAGVYYAAKTGRWPIGRLGAKLLASKSALLRHGRKMAAA